jgi:hypothetical protein
VYIANKTKVQFKRYTDIRYRVFIASKQRYSVYTANRQRYSSKGTQTEGTGCS